jgi:non-ribosomal peptide synthetase component F
VQLPSVGTQFDFVIRYSNRDSEAPQITFEYCQTLFGREQVEVIARSFEETLSTLVNGGTTYTPYTKIHILSAVDEALIKLWSKPSRLSETMEKLWIRGPDLRLHELVELTAGKVPQATAIVTTSGVTVTYSELLARARGLGRRLQSEGLDGREAVLLFLNRSVKLVVAQLAVLLAGAAFVVVNRNTSQSSTKKK